MQKSVIQISILKTAHFVYRRKLFWANMDVRIAYASSVAGTYDIYQKLASGAGQEEPLLRSDRPQFSNDWCVLRFEFSLPFY